MRGYRACQRSNVESIKCHFYKWIHIYNKVRAGARVSSPTRSESAGSYRPDGQPKTQNLNPKTFMLTPTVRMANLTPKTLKAPS